MPGDNVITNSYDYVLGEIHSELKAIKAEQVNINTRLNNQNGQIRAMSVALDRNTQAITDGKPAENARQIADIKIWCKDHDDKEDKEEQTNKQSVISLKNAIIAGIVITVFSVGITWLFTMLDITGRL